jgi:MarR family transcriptional regulator for hemolysin
VASSTSSPALLNDRLAHRLGVAGRLLRTTADAELSVVGLSGPGLAVLRSLSEEDGLTQAELARRLRLEPPSMCRMIDRLARDGTVARNPDPDDRRVTRVRLTPGGRALAEQGMAIVDGIEERIFAGLDADERDQLAELLRRVMDRLPASGPAPS